MSRRLALLISNNQYSDPNLTKLAAPLADAEALASVLRDPTIGAFDDVQTLINQPSSDVRHAIAEFFHGKQPNVLLLLYFSGHGLLDERSRLYLATPDTDAKLPRARSVEAAYIAQEMDDSRSKRQVLILDCCHSGAFRQGIAKNAVGQPVQTGTIFDGDGRMVLAASDATQYAFEHEQLVGDGVRSLFTHYLIEGLEGLCADANGDGVVTVDELYEYLYPRVTAHTPTQTPVKWSYRQRGAFVLAGQGEPGVTPPISPPDSGMAKAPTWRTWIVDQMHRGDFPTVSEAIAAATAGDKIVIHPGIYEEGLVIDKPLEIEGGDDVGDVVIQATDKCVILFKAGIGQVCNLTLRQAGDGMWFCVYIAQGRLLLEGCDISGQSLTCLAISNVANPTVRNNRIHNGTQAGIVVEGKGQGLIEENDIFANTGFGIAIRNEANPTVRNNRIHDDQLIGIIVHGRGRGVIEKNDIFANIHSGITIRDWASPTVRNNLIHLHDGISGIDVSEHGRGVIEKNDVFSNYAGIIIGNGSNPMVRNNRINRNDNWGIVVKDNGSGRFEKNDLRDNQHGAWNIDDDCLPNITRVGNVE